MLLPRAATVSPLSCVRAVVALGMPGWEGRVSSSGGARRGGAAHRDRGGEHGRAEEQGGEGQGESHGDGAGLQAGQDGTRREDGIRIVGMWEAKLRTLLIDGRVSGRPTTNTSPPAVSQITGGSDGDMRPLLD